MKTKVILMILAVNLGQLFAQSSNFRFATTTTTNQVIDSIVAIGTATIPFVGTTIPFVGTMVKPVSKNLYTVDNGNVTVETDYYINASTLLLNPISQVSNTYDGNNIITSSITAKWNSGTSQFVDSVKTEYVYPISDVCIQTIYNIDGGVWVVSDSVKTITAYNINQDPTEKITYASIAGFWIDSLKETTIYDGSDRFTEKEVAVFNGSSWVNFKKSVLTYNVDGKTATAIFYDWDGGAWVASTYSFEGIPATLATTVTYSMVNKTALPVIENAIESVITYPNPTVDGFYVKAGASTVKVEVISVKGELLIEKEVRGTEYVRVNTIGKGTFLVRLSTGGKSITKKLYVK